MEIFQSLNQLIFPSRCISCKSLGDSLCRLCKLSWTPTIYKSKLSRYPDKYVYSSIVYSNIAARIILSAKESHIKSADILVADAILHSLAEFLKYEWIDALIPIPSRKSAVRKRGRQFIEEMADSVSFRTGIRVNSSLVHSRSILDQSGLGFERRWNNLEGAFVVSGNPIGLGRVLLVDDLITTGATLNEATRALKYAGIEVVGAVTAAIAQTVR